jgi:hypothetical protein
LVQGVEVTFHSIPKERLGLGMMIVHDQQMNPIDFGVKGLKVKVTLTLPVKQFPHNN